MSTETTDHARLNTLGKFLTLLLVATVSVPIAVQAQTCSLNSAGGKIKHIIYIQFDNVHFTRDNPNVPSDLEQMPNLTNFLQSNGTLLTQEHTPLISHTADDILTSLTGVYPDRHGQAVANGFGFFTAPGTSKFFDGFASSFTYWTDLVSPPSDRAFSMITPDGRNAPAPWVPYTRAGCDVGGVSIANIELENVSSDISKVFAKDPAKRKAALHEAATNFNKAVADYEGISVHCAPNSPVCSPAKGGEPDILPDEPGGYSGFSALFGHKFVAPVISPNGPLSDLDGNVITDSSNPPNVGFPGFGGIDAAQSLAYVAAMQENGIPITFAYIADIHDNPNGENAHPPAACVTDPAQGGLGPGEVCHNALAASYNEAFGKFFARLKADGITKDNTLFIVTADEGDHFAGGAPVPVDCDGVDIPCTYPAGHLGEIDTNLTAILDAQDSGLTSTSFDIHFDMVPTFYIDPLGPAGAREFERAAAKLRAVDPFTGTRVPLAEYLADPVELKLLHMVTGDPQRTPNFVMFGNPDYFFLTFGSPNFVIDPGFAWNHGGVDPKINTTFLGLVGPGVARLGVQDNVWSDHTDIRPTMLLLAGLTDDYSHDGRALVEALQNAALPKSLSQSKTNFLQLATVYKQIMAPVGFVGLTSLQISTVALAGDDAIYTNLENQLSALTTERDSLAAQIIQVLEAAEFSGQPIDSETTASLVAQAEQLIGQVEELQQTE
jgi:hypothetical protein